VLSETFHLLGTRGGPVLRAMLKRRSLRTGFDFSGHLQPVLNLMEKYGDVPMSLADACLVRMTEAIADSLILTTDADFRVYRRHSRRVVPCRMPY
jgi:predicted nucleic acid-binding protein